MGKYNYLVIGCGRQGKAVIDDLLKNCEAKHLGIVDPMASPKIKHPVSIPITYAVTIEDYFKQISIKPDVILNCASYKANMEIMKFAIKHNISYCDLGGNPAVVEEQARFCNEEINPGCLPARFAVAGSPVVPDCGVSPGISNVLAVHLAKQGYDVIRVRCGGIFDGFAQGNTLNYELLFSPDGLISEYSGECPMLIDGKLVMEESVGDIEPFLHDKLHFDIMSRQIAFECSHTSNNSPETAIYLAEIGVKYYDYQTIRNLGHWSVVRQWKKLGYCLGDKNKDAELISILKANQSLERKHQDILFLMVRAAKSGNQINERKELTIMHMGNPEGFSAMEQMTAYGITLVAYHIVSGLGKPTGFSIPEKFINGEWMIQQLEKRLGVE